MATRQIRNRSIRNPFLRVAVTALVAGLWLSAPLAAQADPTPRYNAHCKRLTRQIHRYEDVADMARSRGDEMWEAGTEAHLDRLEARRDRLCPAYAEGLAKAVTAQFWKDTYELTKQAAKAAARYFTFGAY